MDTLVSFHGHLLALHPLCQQMGDSFITTARWGVAPVQTSTGNTFLEDAREFPVIITSTGVKFWWNFCPSVLHW